MRRGCRKITHVTISHASANDNFSASFSLHRTRHPPPYGILDHPSVDGYDPRSREPAGSINIFKLQAKCAPYDGRKSNATLEGLQSNAISAPFLRGELHHEIKPRTRTTQPECFM